MRDLTKKYVNAVGGQTVWEENELGILVAVETKIEKKERMTRAEWKEYYNNEEITEEQYVEEQRSYIRSLNGHM
jgi:outer membrane lipoprotein-sorting protein